MGGDLLDQYLDEAYPILKSAPPVWAGTCRDDRDRDILPLKSAPPVWAGTYDAFGDYSVFRLKSAPPVWAGTMSKEARALLKKLKSAPPVWAGTGQTRPDSPDPSDLNPPRPCGRGPN